MGSSKRGSRIVKPPPAGEGVARNAKLVSTLVLCSPGRVHRTPRPRHRHTRRGERLSSSKFVSGNGSWAAGLSRPRRWKEGPVAGGTRFHPAPNTFETRRRLLPVRQGLPSSARLRKTAPFRSVVPTVRIPERVPRKIRYARPVACQGCARPRRVADPRRAPSPPRCGLGIHPYKPLTDSLCLLHRKRRLLDLQDSAGGARLPAEPRFRAARRLRKAGPLWRFLTPAQSGWFRSSCLWLSFSGRSGASGRKLTAESQGARPL